MRFSIFARAAVCLLLCATCVSSLEAQNKKFLRFGKVDPAELTMESYELDAEAGAVILFEKEHVYFDVIKDKFQLVFEVHRRVKIFSSSESDQANVEIPFYSFNRMEEVTSVKGMTYNLEDGKIVESKLERDAVFLEDVSDYFSQKKFALPNVKDGSVI
ncbi:MAG: transglutaminase, partial [Bacteroidota bacterium]